MKTRADLNSAEQELYDKITEIYFNSKAIKKESIVRVLGIIINVLKK